MKFPTDAVKEDILDTLNLTDVYKNKGMSKEEKERLIKEFKEVKKTMGAFDCAGVVSQARLDSVERAALVTTVSEKIEAIRGKIYAAAALYAIKGGNVAFSEYVLAVGRDEDPEKLLKAQRKAMVISLDECLEVAKELAEEIADYLYADYIDIINAVITKDEKTEKEEKKEEENPLIALLKVLAQFNDDEKERQKEAKPLPAKKQKTSFADYAKDFI